MLLALLYNRPETENSSLNLNSKVFQPFKRRDAFSKEFPVVIVGNNFRQLTLQGLGWYK